MIARLEFELSDYDSAIHHFNAYTKRTPLILLRLDTLFTYHSLTVSPMNNYIPTNFCSETKFQDFIISDTSKMDIIIH